MATNYCFSHTEKRLSKWREHFVKNGYPFFVEKLKILYSSYRTIFFQISTVYGPNTYQIMYGETLDFQMSASAMVT